MLQNKLTLIIPSVANGQLIDGMKRTGAILTAAKFCCTLGGGATQTQGVGYWQSERDGLVQEDVTLISTFFASEADIARTQAETLIASLKTFLAQEAMAIELNNVLYLV